jgi:hypothetical protein
LGIPLQGQPQPAAPVQPQPQPSPAAPQPRRPSYASGGTSGTKPNGQDPNPFADVLF